MLKLIDTIRFYIKLILIIFSAIKIISTLMLFFSHTYFELFSSFCIYSIPYSTAKCYAITTGYEAIICLCTIFLTALGWPVSIGLIVNTAEKVWIPSTCIALLSVIDVCSYIGTILSWSNELRPPNLSYAVIGIVFNVIIILLSVSYLIICKEAQKQCIKAQTPTEA